MRGTILLVCLAVLSTPAELPSQDVPIAIRRREPAARVRRRTLYERPAVSPWLGADVAFALPLARCSGCTEVQGGPGLAGTVAAGVTLLSRVTIAAERSWVDVIIAEPDNRARLTMITARITTRHGLAAKAGYGYGRYERGSTALVDDRRAWTAGGEFCDLGRGDGCVFVDYAQTARGSPAAIDFTPASYRMQSVRTGFALRLHLLRGRRITLSPRGP